MAQKYHMSPLVVETICQCLADGGTMKEASAKSGIPTGTIKKWKEKHPDFALQVKQAFDDGTDSLKREAWRRAVIGVEEPVFFQGMKVGKIRRYSDSLLVTLLKMRVPEEFVQYQKNEHSGPDGQPLFTGITRKIVRPAKTETPPSSSS